MVREIHNYYTRTREGNLRLFKAAICAMKETTLETIVAGPFNDRAAAVAGLFVSGSLDDLMAFRQAMNDQKPGEYWVNQVA